MSPSGALSSIGSSPVRLAVLRSPVASLDCVPVCSSWLSCSRFSPGHFSRILPPPSCVQKNEPHPQIRLRNLNLWCDCSVGKRTRKLTACSRRGYHDRTDKQLRLRSPDVRMALLRQQCIVLC